MKLLLLLLCLHSSLGLTAISAPPPLTIAIEQIYSCQSGQYFVDVTVTGGVPGYSFQWSTGDGSFASTEDVNLYGGTYWVSVLDDDLNQISQEVHVGLIANITHSSCVVALGEIELDVSTLLPPLSISWYGPDDFFVENGGPVISSLAPGDNVAVVVDGNDCTRYQYFRVNPVDLNGKLMIVR